MRMLSVLLLAARDAFSTTSVEEEQCALFFPLRQSWPLKAGPHSERELEKVDGESWQGLTDVRTNRTGTTTKTLLLLDQDSLSRQV